MNFPTNLLRLTRTAPFKLSMLYAVMFSLSAGLLFAVLYLYVTKQVSAHLRNSVRDEAASLVEEAQRGPSLTVVVNQRTHLSHAQFDYLLLDKNHARLAGSWVVATSWQEGWQMVGPPKAMNGAFDIDDTILALGTPLPDGSLLVVGRGMKSLVEIREVIQESFAIGGVFVLVLSVAGGLLMSVGFLRQIERINTTASRIMDGNMKERIAQRGTRDAFDQLAGNLNLMLDKVESFMEGMRQVSNDIAHDLRTPLTRLRQSLEGAARKATSVEEFRGSVEKAITEADELLATFTGLLQISQIEAGSGGMEATDVDMTALCEKIFEIYEPIARDKGMSLHKILQGDVRLPCNELLMTQLLVNLVENALNHTPEGTEVTVELVMTQDRRIALAVFDNGQGIPDADLERVTKRYVRLERSRNMPGNGLGLALVLAVANRFGGVLQLTDNRPGLRVVVIFG